MQNREVTFSFSPDPITMSSLNHYVMKIVDSSGNLIVSTRLPRLSTTYKIVLTVGIGYRAIFSAYNSKDGVNDNPPTLTFDVPPFPPEIPGNPILNPPVFT